MAAADCQRQMTEYIVRQARHMARLHPVSLQIHYEGDSLSAMTTWLGNDLSYSLQTDGDIGCRMAASFAKAFHEGWCNVILVGSDCPALSPGILHAGLEALHDADLVLGPAIDGGYYLVGLRSPHPELFSDIAWGSKHVLSQTLARANGHHLKVSQLEPLHDIDRPEDLKHFRHYTRP